MLGTQVSRPVAVGPSAVHRDSTQRTTASLTSNSASSSSSSATTSSESPSLLFGPPAVYVAGADRTNTPALAAPGVSKATATSTDINNVVGIPAFAPMIRRHVPVVMKYCNSTDIIVTSMPPPAVVTAPKTSDDMIASSDVLVPGGANNKDRHSHMNLAAPVEAATPQAPPSLATADAEDSGHYRSSSFEVAATQPTTPTFHATGTAAVINDTSASADSTPASVTSKQQQQQGQHHGHNTHHSTVHRPGGFYTSNVVGQGCHEAGDNREEGAAVQSSDGLACSDPFAASLEEDARARQYAALSAAATPCHPMGQEQRSREVATPISGQRAGSDAMLEKHTPEGSRTNVCSSTLMSGGDCGGSEVAPPFVLLAPSEHPQQRMSLQHSMPNGNQIRKLQGDRATGKVMMAPTSSIAYDALQHRRPPHMQPSVPLSGCALPPPQPSEPSLSMDEAVSLAVATMGGSITEREVSLLKMLKRLAAINTVLEEELKAARQQLCEVAAKGAATSDTHAFPSVMSGPAMKADASRLSASLLNHREKHQPPSGAEASGEGRAAKEAFAMKNSVHCKRVFPRADPRIKQSTVVSGPKGSSGSHLGKPPAAAPFTWAVGEKVSSISSSGGGNDNTKNKKRSGSREGALPARATAAAASYTVSDRVRAVIEKITHEGWCNEAALREAISVAESAPTEEALVLLDALKHSVVARRRIEQRKMKLGGVHAGEDKMTRIATTAGDAYAATGLSAAAAGSRRSVRSMSAPAPLTAAAGGGAKVRCHGTPRKGSSTLIPLPRTTSAKRASSFSSSAPANALASEEKRVCRGVSTLDTAALKDSARASKGGGGGGTANGRRAASTKLASNAERAPSPKSKRKKSNSALRAVSCLSDAFVPTQMKATDVAVDNVPVEALAHANTAETATAAATENNCDAMMVTPCTTTTTTAAATGRLSLNTTVEVVVPQAQVRPDSKQRVRSCSNNTFAGKTGISNTSGGAGISQRTRQRTASTPGITTNRSAGAAAAATATPACANASRSRVPAYKSQVAKTTALSAATPRAASNSARPKDRDDDHMPSFTGKVKASKRNGAGNALRHMKPQSSLCTGADASLPIGVNSQRVAAQVISDGTHCDMAHAHALEPQTVSVKELQAGYLAQSRRVLAQLEAMLMMPLSLMDAV